MNSESWSKLGPWLMVALWSSVPFTTGELLDNTVNDTGLRWAVALGAWTAWMITLTATLIRRPVTLTAVRLGTSGAAVVAIAAAAVDTTSSTLLIVAATLVPVTSWVLSMTAEVGARFVDGASYGDERRFPLKPPVMLLVGAVPVAWVMFIVGAIAGPLLLGSQHWVLGVIALMIGWPVAFTGARALHGLSRRWLVFVPAGVVIHDFLTAREPFLMMRNTVTSLDGAPPDIALEGEDFLDATQRAAGIVVMIELEKAVEVVLRPARGEPFEVRRVNRVAVTPSRPGAVIAEARARRLG